MITEAILGVLIDIIGFLVKGLLDVFGAPVSGTFSIPRPLLSVAEIFVFAFTGVYPAMLVWFLWRQVKA